VTSLAVAYDFHAKRGRPDYAHRIVRLNIGLEHVSDLQEDLIRALDGLDGDCTSPEFFRQHQSCFRYTTKPERSATLS
jgi:hypothetical protein